MWDPEARGDADLNPALPCGCTAHGLVLREMQDYEALWAVFGYPSAQHCATHSILTTLATDTSCHPLALLHPGAAGSGAFDTLPTVILCLQRAPLVPTCVMEQREPRKIIATREAGRQHSRVSLLNGPATLQVQIFDEVPELAARAILHLLEVHPRSVVENLIKAKGLESLCPVMVLDDPMNHHEKGKTEGAIKVPPEPQTPSASGATLCTERPSAKRAKLSSTKLYFP